jgi:DNA-binding MarR family transcriptional regulator
MQDPQGRDARATSLGTTVGTRSDDVSLGVLDQYIGFHLRLAQNASFKAFKRLTGESDLKPGWFAVMMLVHVNPGITPMALSRASGRDKSTLTPVLRDLESRGYLDRYLVPRDKRSYALALTASGEEMLSKLADHAAAHDRKIDEIVGCPNKAELLALLRKIALLLE